MPDIISLWLLLQSVPLTGAPSSATNASSQGLATTLDIAAAISAILWPLIVLVALLAYRQKIPALLHAVAGRISKLEFVGVSLDLAKAAAFVPEWAGSAGALDLRQKATSIQVNDSTAMTFRTQLMEEGTADYAEVRLGSDQEWLTSRLYIMAIVFARVKGIQCFVFLETAGDVRKRCLGWAEPEKVRWALARRYPWLEQAYSEAYSGILTRQNAFVVTNQGKLGYQLSTNDPGPSIELVREFLQRVQAPPIPTATPDTSHRVLIDASTNTYEHASWITSGQLEDLLGSDLSRSGVHSSELRSKNARGQVRMFLSLPERFQAVKGDDQRFEYLLDRNVLLEQVARNVSSESDSGSEKWSERGCAPLKLRYNNRISFR